MREFTRMQDTYAGRLPIGSQSAILLVGKRIQRDRFETETIILFHYFYFHAKLKITFSSNTKLALSTDHTLL